MEEQYKGYIIHINRVPEAQFESSVGFGWGFQVRNTDEKTLIFRVIVKSFSSESSEDYLNTVKEFGLNQTKKFIDEGWDSDEYCYRWEASDGFTSTACDEITPLQFRSPKI